MTLGKKVFQWRKGTESGDRWAETSVDQKFYRVRNWECINETLVPESVERQIVFNYMRSKF